MKKNTNFNHINIMKRIIMSGVFIMLTLAAFGQKSAVDRVFDRYGGQEGYTTVFISSYMFNLMSNLKVDDPDYKEFQKATSGINSIRILTQEGEGSQSFGSELISMLPREEYREMMVVKEEDEEVLFLAREEGGKITEFLLIVSGNGDDALIAIKGEIDLASISKLASGLDMPGMENLEDLDEE